MFNSRNNTPHKLEKYNQISIINSSAFRVLLIHSNFISPFRLSCNYRLHHNRMFTRMYGSHTHALAFHVRPRLHRDRLVDISVEMSSMMAAMGNGAPSAEYPNNHRRGHRQYLS